MRSRRALLFIAVNALIVSVMAQYCPGIRMPINDPEESGRFNHPHPRAICFVCDGGASMRANFPAMQRELARAVVGLRPNQEMNITFTGEGASQVFDIEPAPANPSRKEAAVNFINHATAAGKSDLLSAMDAALRDRPRFVYMLIGPDFPPEKALAHIRSSDLRHTRINFIAFANSAEVDNRWFARMKQIAAENNGVFRISLTNDPSAYGYADRGFQPKAAPVDNRDDCIPDGHGNDIFAQQHHARRIVYLIETRGSMSDKMPMVLREVRKAIGKLSTDQSFDIIFTRPVAPRVMYEDFMPATLENKSNALAAAEAVPTHHAVDPLPSIDAAFALKPDLIYFIAGDEFADHDAVVKRFETLNAPGRVMVNTVAFLDHEERWWNLIDAMRFIHQENGGVFRCVYCDLLPNK